MSTPNVNDPLLPTNFSEETYRLLRPDWETLGLGAFSQEAWAVLQMLQQYQSNGTQTFVQGQQPPITINQPLTIPPGPAIVLNRGPNQQLTIGPDGIQQNGQPIQAAGGIPGTIVSGTGDTYLVSIPNSGVVGGTKNVTVKQLQIDPDATIPVGTSVVVFIGTGGTYFMAVPVWL